ncbi:MAG: FAD-dependent oxidoreductase, partial [Woeseia sp.]
MNKLQTPLRRREFLSGIGRAVGGSVMLRVMSAMGIATAAGCGSSSASSGAPGVPPPPPRPASPSPRPGDWPANVGSGRSVVILGAGIAGMTAALELGRLGYTCTLLEATAAAGGRVRTLRAGDIAEETDSTQLCNFDLDDDLYFNCGPARIAHHHEFLLGYCREFGVALEPFVNDNRAALLHSASTFGGEPQIARRILADTRGNIARLLASAINQNALDQELSANDRANVLVLLRQFGDLDGASAYKGSERAGFPGQEANGSRERGQLLDPRSLQELAQETFWQQRVDFTEQLDQQATMLQPVGGMDRIARAFESQLLQQIRFEAMVTQIRKLADGARVVYTDRNGLEQAIDADHCICTIPASVLRSIDNDFSAAHQSAIAAFAYTPAFKLAFQSRR